MTILAPKVAMDPASRGFVVMILMVEPTPPVAAAALPVLCTITAEIPSEARSPKSNERLVPLCVGICRPLSVTRLYSGPKPRTVTWLPSPRCRLIETPVTLCRDSARFVSGNLPISSDEIASATPAVSRLISIERLRLARIPPSTTISSITPSS